MVTELVMFILGVSLILYMILGGADFGAGILELIIGDKSESTVSRAMAPVWEANHMWLVIAVVILFNGFPKAYIILSTNLHIPVMLFLIAIIFRGTAFTFRHYDAYKDNSQKLYSNLFRYSSLLAVFFLGVTTSAFFSGTLPAADTGTFAEIYVYPWFNWFSFSVGIFLVTISTYIAGIFLLGEVSTDEGYRIIVKHIKWVFALAILSGIGIFMASIFSSYLFHQTFFNNPFAISAGIISSLLVPYIFKLIKLKKTWKLRIIVGAQIVLIMMGWFAIQWPNIAIFDNGSTLTMYNAASPYATMKVLLIALGIGVAIIFPSLYYLFKIFKSEDNMKDAR